MVIRRFAAVATLAAVLAGSTAGLASAATGSPASWHNDPVPPACAATSKLTTDLTGITGALLPTPDPSKLEGLLSDVLGTLGGLAQSGCLPTLPTGSGTAPPSVVPATCVPALLQVAGDVIQLLLKLTAVPPDLAGVTTGVTTLLGDLTKAVTGSCLPGVSVPTLPVPLPLP